MAMLFSEHQAALFEGKQAEEYKAKKAEQAKKDADFGKERFKAEPAVKSNRKYKGMDVYEAPKGDAFKKGNDWHGRVNDDKSEEDVIVPGNKMTKDNPNYHPYLHPKKTKAAKDEDKERNKIADDRTSRHNRMSGNALKNNKYAFEYARDASRRHERRHPTKESFGIFAEMVDTDEPTQYGDQMTRDDLVPDDEICNGIQHQYNGIEKTGNGIDDNGAPVDESYGIFEPMMEGKLKDLDKKLRDNKSKQASDDDPFNGKYNVTSPDGSRTDKFGSMKRRFEVGPYATDWKTPSEKHIKKAYDKKRKEYGYV